MEVSIQEGIKKIYKPIYDRHIDSNFVEARFALWHFFSLDRFNPHGQDMVNSENGARKPTKLGLLF